MYKILNSGELKPYYEIDPKDSWMLAAAVVCDQASAVGTPDSELAVARKAAETALGDAWRKFRVTVPPPRRIEAPIYRAES